MADAKNCPTCGLVNPPDARRCDCGYDFVTRQGPGCQLCGVQAETRYVSFQQNIGALVVRFHSSVQGQMCRSCVDQQFWTKTMTTLILGWWGVISFFVTPYVLLTNISRYLACRGMAPAPPRAAAAGPGGGPRPKQLVGQNCARCGQRIPDELDSRFCRTCGSPVHNRCAVPAEGNGCPACGAAARTA